MAQIYGQIDSLKQIRIRLNQKGIDRFNSINDISTFLKNYESEKTTVLKYFENELENDIDKLKEHIKYNHEVSENIKNETIKLLDAKIKLNLISLEQYSKKNKDSFLAKYIILTIVFFLETRGKYLQKNYNRIIRISTYKSKAKINGDTKKLNEFINNKKNIISERSTEKIKELVYTKKSVLEINPLIAGAIGENLVTNEINKLPNDYILINDFSLTFDPPMYNKKENDRIYSIQIDHLLISKSGVYVLETKNWSKKSIKSFDLRSPIKQINRTNFALFKLLNNKNIKLDKHHWGEKQIPIRSIIVMINQKPKEEFKYVKVLILKELNRYIQFFDPIFNDKEYHEISKNLINLSNKNNTTVNTNL